MYLRVFFAGLCGAVFAYEAYATSAPSQTQPVSKYGLIQNVQNYSSNPFWNPNGPYNQRMPQPVYAQGADLNTGDCQRTVSTLVASYCSANNNCIGMTLSQVRPTIMLQLSRLPGHNYATSCAGYLDSEFNSYVSKYANAGPQNGYVAFPAATTANPNLQQTDFKINNPYQIQLPDWTQEMIERKQEIKNLEASTGSTPQLAKNAFPTTAADLSFSERMENKRTGYEPYKDSSAYMQINIESEETYLNRETALQEQRNKLQQLNDQNTMSQEEYCKKYPTDTTRCMQQVAATEPAQDNNNNNNNNNGAGGASSQTPGETVFIL